MSTLPKQRQLGVLKRHCPHGVCTRNRALVALWCSTHTRHLFRNAGRWEAHGGVATRGHVKREGPAGDKFPRSGDEGNGGRVRSGAKRNVAPREPPIYRSWRDRRWLRGGIRSDELCMRVHALDLHAHFTPIFAPEGPRSGPSCTLPRHTDIKRALQVIRPSGLSKNRSYLLSHLVGQYHRRW